MTTEITLTLIESQDLDDGIVRLDTNDLRMLGVVSGSIVCVEGTRRVYLQALPASNADRNQRMARLSPLAAKNIGMQTGQKVRITPERVKPPYAELVILQADDDIDHLHLSARCKSVSSHWARRVVQAEDEMQVPTLDRYPLMVKVVSTQPQGPVQITRMTEFAIASRRPSADLVRIGGLRETYKTCHSLLNARFVKGRVSCARSILLAGPTGCGKARLVTRLAQDFGVPLHVLDVYQLVDRRIVQGGLDLGGYLSEVGRKGKGIVLINHLDALKSKVAMSPSLAATSHAVLAQICSMLEELPTQPNLVVFGVASGAFDLGVLNNQRFDIHLSVDTPNCWGREEIFSLASAEIALHEGVNLNSLAELSAGMTAQDIEHVVRTAELLATGTKVTDQDFMTALRSVKPSASSEVFCDVPSVTWDQVAGLDDIKLLMQETLSWTLSQLDSFVRAGVRPPRSILLSGGQGTGKTSLVRALANRVPLNFIEISCPLLMAKHRDDSMAYLAKAFHLARRKSPCLLFFDDIDGLFDVTSSPVGTPANHPLVSQLIAELDSISALMGIIVIAATNRPDRLTPEILRPGRFDYAVTLPLPDLLARKKILQIHARQLPLAEGIDFDKLAASTSGMSSAEIAGLCNRVGLMALRQSLSMQEPDFPPVVTSDLFDQALRGRKS